MDKYSIIRAGLVPALLFAWYLGQSGYTKKLEEDQIERYKKDGILIVEDLLQEDEFKEVKEQLMKRVRERPEDMRAEDLLNLHFNDSYLLDLAKHPVFLDVASQLLESPGLRLFTTRILCKLPGQSISVPWHQDSNYWPLQPMKVSTLWMALDDVTEDNGAMRMMPFSRLPQSKAKHLPSQKQEETGADFFIKIDESNLPLDQAMLMTLKKGQAEFHDAFILHSSPPNKSDRPRCAWISRYVPDYVHIPKGSWRKMYQDDYELIRVR